MLAETDEQLAAAVGKPATHAFVSVGAGSIGQAVTQHYKKKTEGPSTAVAATEADTAAGLQASLRAGEVVTVPMGNTIMAGMNYGSVSRTAWPVLRYGASAAVSVTDAEADAAVRELEGQGISSGPCGAANLAALRKVVAEAKSGLGLGEESVVVLFSTEGMREYHLAA